MKSYFLAMYAIECDKSERDFPLYREFEAWQEEAIQVQATYSIPTGPTETTAPPQRVHTDPHQTVSNACIYTGFAVTKSFKSLNSVFN